MTNRAFQALLSYAIMRVSTVGLEGYIFWTEVQKVQLKVL
jgi:hypothetical protein